MATIQEKDPELSTDKDYYGRSHMEMLGDPEFQTWLRRTINGTDPRNAFTSTFAFYMKRVAKASQAALLDDSPTSERLPLIEVLQNIHSPAEVEQMTNDLNHGCKTAIQRAHDRDSWLDYVASRVEKQGINAQVGFHAQVVWRVFELSVRRKSLTPILQSQSASGEFVLVRPQRLRK